MHEPARYSSLSWLGPIVVFAAALGLRGWYLVELTDQGRAAAPLRVQDERSPAIDDQLEQFREHHDFFGRAPWSTTAERTAFASPGYPFFVFAVSQFPIETGPAVRWTQCLLGALTALCWCVLAGRLFGSPLVGFLAGLFCAVHPFWIVNTAEIDDGVLSSFLLALALLLGTVGARSGGAFASLAFGLVLALLALVRASLLPFAFVAVLWYLWQCRSWSRSWVASALVFLGFVNGLLPWAVRNFQAFHDVVPVVDSTYYHLWVGNNPMATGGPVPAETLARSLAQQKDEGTGRTSREMDVMEENRRYDSLAPPAFREIRDEPGKTLQRRLWAGLCFWFGQDLLENHGAMPNAIAGDAESHWLVRAWPGIVSGTLLAMISLALLGWRWSSAWAADSRLVTFAVVCCFLPYLLSHGETLFGPRLPLDGALLTLAAFALVGKRGRGRLRS